MSIKQKHLDAALYELKAIQKNHKLFPTEANANILENKLAYAEALKKEVESDRLIKSALSDLAPAWNDDGRDPSKEQVALAREGGYSGGTSSAPGAGLYGAVKNAGFALYEKNRVIVPHESVTNVKADLIADAPASSPGFRPGVSELGIDQRHLFPFLPQTGIPWGQTAVTYLRQDSRTLAAAEDMTLAQDATSTKPTTESVMVSVTEAPSILATISSPQPVQLYFNPALRTVLQHDMTSAYRRALDDHTLDTIEAASGVHTFTQTTELLEDVVFKAAQELVNSGYNPSICVMGTANYQTLSLERDGDDHYMRQPGSALWNLRTVVSPLVAATRIVLIDPSVINLYLSPISFLADTSLYFETNRVVARLEGLALPSIVQPEGISLVTTV